MVFSGTNTNKPNTRDVKVRVERKVIGIIETIAKLKGKSASEITAQALIEFLEDISGRLEHMCEEPDASNPVLPLKCRTQSASAGKRPPPDGTQRKKSGKASAAKKSRSAKLKISHAKK